MLEWLKRHAWKACIRQKRIGGSNPPLSAKESCKSKDLQDSFIIILPCPSKITFTTYSVVLYIFYIISYKPSATICLWHIHSLIFKKKERNHNLLKHSENELPSLGEGWGGAYNQLFFLPPKAAFFYGHRPLFEPWRLLSSCKAWRWGWRRRHGGKRVFRLASPTATKRRSRQQPPWLFVFISSTNRSS